MRVIDFFETVYRRKRLKPNATNTRRLYLESLKKLDLLLGKPADLSDLTSANIELVMQATVDAGGAIPTANKHRDQLLAIGRYAHRLGLAHEWPDVRAYQEPERTPTAWLASEISQLIDACKRQRGKIGNVPADLYWETLVRVCFDSGERIGALLGVRWEDVEKEWMLCRAENRKGGKRDRKYMLGPETVACLVKLRPFTFADEVVFKWPYCYTYLWPRYKKVLRSAGLPANRTCAFHRIRRSTASIAHAAGMNAQELLDHSHRRVTQAYLDPRFTRQEQASEIFARYLADPTIAHRDSSTTKRAK